MKSALFAGTFDPPTLGHQELIERAAALFGKLYVAVAESQGKHAIPIGIEERISMLKILTEKLKNVEVIPLTGLVVDCAKKLHVDCLVRGIRDGADLLYEMQMAYANKAITEIETVCLFSSPEYCRINSTLTREIASYGKDLKGFVPASIEKKISELLISQRGR